LQAAIKDKYGITARLIEGAGGIFEVFINEQLAYTNKDTYRFPENEEIFAEIDKAKA
jgi:selT/selW/selH-like putative selenoprotein